ncbi:helix-turn-helix transcriptional regulator [Halorubrum lacusprofundi]|jgi:hypothetical protein|uniref:Uncharacterized protein n=2 Tax=Halorubrum lacusprofundi TaxID=2247 RepID=B9LPE0_HALLT|nr:helix-turn-helix transcriptional regulator [Halorubrum lacusprofundi]ACM57228.1 hypothetical protein Hlac_1643 [Halorubrum lacusprofundi ATCC 49239]
MSTESSTPAELTEELTKERVRSHRDDVIQQGFSTSEIALIEALPASGKSYGVLQWGAETDNQMTILAPHHDLLNEYENWCAELNLSVKRLPSFHRDCESVSLDDDGEPADERTKELLGLYRQGIRGERIHQQASKLVSSNLACQHDGECPYIQKLNIDTDAYDVLLGHYLHAYQTDWTDERYVAVDEFPGDAFVQEFTGHVPPAVTAYLQQEDRLPFHDYAELLERQSEFQDEVEAWKEDVWSDYDAAHVLRNSNSSAHALAPLMTRANLEKERLDNRWQFADLGRGKVAARNTDHQWSFLLPPNFEGAESVVVLDGTPVIELWELVMGADIERIPLLDDDQKQLYLESVLGLNLVQTTDNWNAYQGGEGVSPTVDIPVVEKIAEVEGRNPGVITSKKGLNQYENHGLNSLVTQTENYGGLKGINTLGTTRVGVILGNPHPGDDVIEKWGALANISVERQEGTEGKNTDYGPFGNRAMEAEIQNKVLQAAMRFGRTEEHGEKGATVYVHTSALPEWVEAKKRFATVDSWITHKNGMKQVIETIRNFDDWKALEWKVGKVAECVTISKNSTRKHLKTLAEQGYLDKRTAGRGGAFHFSNVRLEEAQKYGHVEFAE